MAGLGASTSVPKRLSFLSGAKLLNGGDGDGLSASFAEVHHYRRVRVVEKRVAAEKKFPRHLTRCGSSIQPPIDCGIRDPQWAELRNRKPRWVVVRTNLRA